MQMIVSLMLMNCRVNRIWMTFQNFRLAMECTVWAILCCAIIYNHSKLQSGDKSKQELLGRVWFNPGILFISCSLYGVAPGSTECLLPNITNLSGRGEAKLQTVKLKSVASFHSPLFII